MPDENGGFLGAWLKALSEWPVELANPAGRNHPEVDEVTFYDFGSFVYALDPWGARTPLTTDHTGESRFPPAGAGQTDNSIEQDSLGPEAISWLGDFAIQLIAEVFSSARELVGGAFNEEEAKTLLGRMITVTTTKLVEAYGLERTPLRRDQMAIHFVENALTTPIVDRFAAMSEMQKNRFLVDFDQEIVGWVARSSMLDRPWTGGYNLPVYHVGAEWDVMDGTPSSYHETYDQGEMLAWEALGYSHHLAMEFREPPFMAPGEVVYETVVGGTNHYLVESLEVKHHASASHRMAWPTSLLGGAKALQEILLEKADEILAEAPGAEENAEEVLSWLEDLLSGLGKSLIPGGGDASLGLLGHPHGRSRSSLGQAGDPQKEQYGFLPYPYPSINLGLQRVYRQEWRPIGIAEGDLVKTIPLGPGQTEKVVVRQLKRERVTRRAEEASTEETTRETRIQTTNASEVVEEAARSSKWHVGVSAQTSGEFDVLFADGQASVTAETDYDRHSSNSSRSTKRQLAESMQRAAVKLRREKRLVVDTEQEFVYEETRTSEIRNPNDSLPVTYYYFTLQQQYEVYTYLASVEPVLLVAEELVSPEELTVEWVRRHGWILSRVLLDASFSDILGKLNSRSVGSLREELTYIREEIDTIKAALKHAYSEAAFGNLGSGTVGETYSRTLDAFQTAIQSGRELATEVSTLLEEAKRFGRHLADNILHYSRAIWSAEDPERRKMRYWDWQWPTRFRRVEEESEPDDSTGGWRIKGRFEPIPGSEAPLSELIDPSGPLGFTGNYAIFRIRDTLLTAGYSQLLWQVARPYFGNPDLKVTGAVAGARVSYPDLYIGANYDITRVADSHINPGDFEITRTFLGEEEKVPAEGLDIRQEEVRGTELGERKTLTVILIKDDGVEIAFVDPPAKDTTFSVRRSEVELRDPELLALRLKFPRKTDDELRERLKEENTRLVLVDTGNLKLDIDPKPLLEPFKQLHRLLDVALVGAEIDRRHRLLESANLSDPDIEKLVVLGKCDLSAILGGSQTEDPPP